MPAKVAARAKLLILTVGLYAVAPKVGYALLRITVGAILFMHGWTKVKGGVAPEVGFFVQQGFPQPALCAYTIMFFETIGSIGVVLGLFTRLFAAELAIDLGIAFLAIQYPHGFSASHGGYEYVLVAWHGDVRDRAARWGSAVAGPRHRRRALAHGTILRSCGVHRRMSG